MAEGIDYLAVLADLKARRARYDDLIAGIEATIIGQAEGPSVSDLVQGKRPLQLGPIAAIHPDTFFGLAIGEAAKKYLKMAGRAQHTGAIADALAKGGMKRPPENNLSSILVRAAKGREVVKVGKGMWGLSEWYPKPPKESAEDQKRPARRAKTNSAPSAKRTRKRRASARATTTPASKQPTSNLADVTTGIIRAAGKPIHAAEITRLVNDQGVKIARLPMEGFLNRQAKAGKLKKIAPSMFAYAS